MKQNFFPNQIGDFIFLNTINDVGSMTKYKFAVYKSRTGKMAFAKYWSGSVKNIDYFWLKNEIIFYQLIEKRTKTLIKLQKRFPKIKIPKLYYSEIRQTKLLLLIEFVKAKPLEVRSSSEKVRTDIQVLSYLRELSTLLKNDMHKFPSRPPRYWVLIFPLIWFKAVFRHPSQIDILFNTLSYFITHLSKLLDYKEKGLVHRDLSDFNIRCSNKQIWIFDFQLYSIMNPIIESVVILFKHWGDKKFVNEFIKKNNSVDSEIFKIYAILIAVYDLAVSDGAQEQITIDFLKSHLGFYSSSMYIQACKDYPFNQMLSNKKSVHLKPYNPKAKVLANRIVKQINNSCPGVEVKFIGSVALGIAGQNDIDLIVETQAGKIQNIFPKLSNSFGPPSKKRTKFIEWKFERSGFDVEINLMETETSLYRERVFVFELLKNNRSLLKEYSKLKHELDGKSLRDYEIAKGRFLNGIRGIS